MAKWDAYDEINNLIIEGLDNGVGPWSRPWTTKAGDDACTGLEPFNPCSKSGGRPYHGANPWVLAIRSMIEGWDDPRFCTAKQAYKRGWSIKPEHLKKNGAKGGQAVYLYKQCKRKEVDEETGQEVVRQGLCFRVYWVYNFAQLDGPEAWVVEDGDEEPQEQLECLYEAAKAVCEAYPVPVKHGGNRAFYRPKADCIHLPDQDRFNTEADYWVTRFHEMAHSTGHADRLNRSFKGRFGSNEYAFEELIAEITAANLCTAYGITPAGELREDHVQYIAQWQEAIRNDKHTVFSAFKQARLASELIIDYAEPLEQTG